MFCLLELDQSIFDKSYFIKSLIFLQKHLIQIQYVCILYWPPEGLQVFLKGFFLLHALYFISFRVRKCGFTHASRAEIRIFTPHDIKFRTILVRKTFSWQVWLYHSPSARAANSHSSENVSSHSYRNVLLSVPCYWSLSTGSGSIFGAGASRASPRINFRW